MWSAQRILVINHNALCQIKSRFWPPYRLESAASASLTQAHYATATIKIVSNVVRKVSSIQLPYNLIKIVFLVPPLFHAWKYLVPPLFAPAPLPIIIDRSLMGYWWINLFYIPYTINKVDTRNPNIRTKAIKYIYWFISNLPCL